MYFLFSFSVLSSCRVFACRTSFNCVALSCIWFCMLQRKFFYRLWSTTVALSSIVEEVHQLQQPFLSRLASESALSPHRACLQACLGAHDEEVARGVPSLGPSTGHWCVRACLPIFVVCCVSCYVCSLVRVLLCVCLVFRYRF